MARVVGIEPTITGPKPVALPVGYTLLLAGGEGLEPPFLGPEPRALPTWLSPMKAG